MTTGPVMQQKAEEGFRQNVVIKDVDRYQIFKLPEGFFDHNVLFLWKEGHDGPLPGRMPIEIFIEGRHGCLCHHESQFPE